MTSYVKINGLRFQLLYLESSTEFDIRDKRPLRTNFTLLVLISMNASLLRKKKHITFQNAGH